MLNTEVRRSHPDPLSTHVLDTSLGTPAAGVEVVLSRMGGGGPGAWMKINSM